MSFFFLRGRENEEEIESDLERSTSTILSEVQYSYNSMRNLAAQGRVLGSQKDTVARHINYAMFFPFHFFLGMNCIIRDMTWHTSFICKCKWDQLLPPPSCPDLWTQQIIMAKATLKIAFYLLIPLHYLDKPAILPNVCGRSMHSRPHQNLFLLENIVMQPICLIICFTKFQLLYEFVPHLAWSQPPPPHPPFWSAV